MKTALLFNTPYDPKYPWRPKYFWDSCPECFEIFYINFKCNSCGSGKEEIEAINNANQQNNT